MWIADQQVQTLGIKYAVRFIVQLGECSYYSCLENSWQAWQATVWCCRVGQDFETKQHQDFPGGTVIRRSPADAGTQRGRFDPWVRRVPGEGKPDSPPPVFLSGQFHGQSLVSYRSWDTGVDTTGYHHHHHNGITFKIVNHILYTCLAILLLHINHINHTSSEK